MIVLLGAGTTGRVIARDLSTRGISFVFADNDPVKQSTIMEGAHVFAPEQAQNLYPDATWIPSVVRPERHEIIEQLAAMQVKTEALWGYLPKRHTLPPPAAIQTIESLLGDQESADCLFDQRRFRSDPNGYKQAPPSDINEIYWPAFIKRRADEHFVDCGAADGDTVQEFMKRWEKWDSIIAFEPDRSNYAKLCLITDPDGQGRITQLGMAVSDFDGDTTFVATADYSSHLGDGKNKVRVTTLDQMCGQTAPTFIKMDIEGSEAEALWGARRILCDYSPVLAICAYHEAEHLWTLPLLIHALQPEYKLFLRRYAEHTFELVYYAVPPDRIVHP